MGEFFAFFFLRYTYRALVDELNGVLVCIYICVCVYTTDGVNVIYNGRGETSRRAVIFINTFRDAIGKYRGNGEAFSSSNAIEIPTEYNRNSNRSTDFRAIIVYVRLIIIIIIRTKWFRPFFNIVDVRRMLTVAFRNATCYELRAITLNIRRRFYGKIVSNRETDGN